MKAKLIENDTVLEIHLKKKEIPIFIDELGNSNALFVGSALLTFQTILICSLDATKESEPWDKIMEIEERKLDGKS